MLPSFREFDAGPDPFDRTWHVKFGWLQTAVAIRHADTVDVKFFLSHGDERMERVIALPLPYLGDVASCQGREVTDPWCCRLAALHLKHIIETGDDIEKTLVTVTRDRLERYATTVAGNSEVSHRTQPD